ncbi:MAG: exodeoxyribonuclease VII large subunit, partial [Lachnospiraceae bacterium]|nr:exodeoxyribonuclease VII large subunit [Lachnospiraceae bacterium]
MQYNIYSVSQINNYIKNMFLTDGFLQNVSLRGEVSNCKYHSSGHIYFSVKDEKSSIRCVMFASSRRGLNFTLQDGMKIVIKGSVNVYDRDGSYQVYATSIEKEGLGDLYEEYEKLKKRLMEQGMFDEEYKRPIPKHVKKLGVVTAETGAAVRDIINVSKRRNPGVQIVLYPAIVQGDDAPESIITGIRVLEEYGVDVIIVGRGGGSIEDLWGFNDEMVAHAIFNCDVPVISAVGHETDFTIADFVSDLRAPTPSAAAELANTDMMAVVSDLNDKKETLNWLIKNNL